MQRKLKKPRNKEAQRLFNDPFFAKTRIIPDKKKQESKLKARKKYEQE